MEFIIDDRERKPYIEYFDNLRHNYAIKRLPVGDYSIAGYPGFVIERKELNDFVQSISRDRERFERELLKAKDIEYFAVVLEFTLYDIQNHRYHSEMSPHSVVSTIFSWNIKYNLPFLFVESRTGGALAVIEMAKAYLKYRSDTNEQ